MTHGTIAYGAKSEKAAKGVVPALCKGEGGPGRLWSQLSGCLLHPMQRTLHHERERVMIKLCGCCGVLRAQRNYVGINPCTDGFTSPGG